MLNKKQLDAWPNCSVNGCVNKSCLRLNSDKCYPHTKRGGIEEMKQKPPLTYWVYCDDTIASDESASPIMGRIIVLFSNNSHPYSHLYCICRPDKTIELISLNCRMKPVDLVNLISEANDVMAYYWGDK